MHQPDQQLTGNFFLIIPPGLENLALEELKEKWELSCGLVLPEQVLPLTYSLEEGGLELTQIPYELGYALNLILKIPTRILLRLSSFKCRDFPKLFNKIKKYPWHLFLAGHIPEVEVSAHSSRLMHKRRIAEAVSDGIKAYFKGHPPKQHLIKSQVNLPPFTVYVRFFADQCTLSLDTSGLPLYKRWEGKKVGEAPLRENLAAALFYGLQKHFQAHWHNILLIDPLCGSGTLLAEAKNFDLSHARQDYAFWHFPHLSKTQHPLSLPARQKLLKRSYKLHCWGLDKDIQTLAYAKENYEKEGIQFVREDLFGPGRLLEQLQSQKNTFDAICLISNPPYGKRLAIDSSASDYFAGLIKQLHKKWQPQLLACLMPEPVPEKRLAQILASPMQPVCKFRNGGVKVAFMMVSFPS